MHAYRGGLTGFVDDDDVRALIPDATAPAALRVFVTIMRFYHHRATGHGSAEERLAEIQAAVALSRFALDEDLELHAQCCSPRMRARSMIAVATRPRSTCSTRFERWLPAGADLTLRSMRARTRTEVYCLAGMLDRAEGYVAALTDDARRSGSVAIDGPRRPMRRTHQSGAGGATCRVPPVARSRPESPGSGVGE